MGKKLIIKFPVHACYINTTAAIFRPKTVSASYEHYTNCTTSHILANFRKASHSKLPAYIIDLLFCIYFFLYFSDSKLSCMLTSICSYVSLKLLSVTNPSCNSTCIIHWSICITSYATPFLWNLTGPRARSRHQQSKRMPAEHFTHWSPTQPPFTVITDRIRIRPKTFLSVLKGIFVLKNFFFSLRKLSVSNIFVKNKTARRRTTALHSGGCYIFIEI